MTLYCQWHKRGHDNWDDADACVKKHLPKSWTTHRPKKVPA